MRRSYAELRQILELWEKGLSKKGISIELNIPRATVHDCIYRYGAIANLDAVMKGELPKSPDIISPRLLPRKLVVPASKPRERQYTDDDLKQAIATSVFLAEVLRKLKVRDAGGNYDLLRRRIQTFKIDNLHLQLGHG